jgi:hypothetical protein
VKVDRTRDDDVRVFDKSAVEFDGRAAFGRPELNVLRRIVRTVIERADALDDERREQFAFLFRCDGAMNAGGEDDAQIRRRDAELDETPDEQINHLPARRLARRIGDDDEHALARRDNLFERLRVERVVNGCTNLCIGERGLGVFVRRGENLKAFRLINESDAPAPVA